MVFFLNRCVFVATANGTSDFDVSTAATGFLVPDDAGAVNARSYNYFAQSNDLTEWELGHGTYLSSGAELGRTVVLSSNSNGLVDFSLPPKVHMGCPLAADITGDTAASSSQIRTGTVASKYIKVDTLSAAMQENSGLFGSAGHIAWDMTTGYEYFSCILDGNYQVDNPSGWVPGRTSYLILTQDSTGSRTVTWDTNFDFGQDSAPTLSTVASKSDLIYFFVTTGGRMIYLGFRKDIG
jgi:hypothetical protein